MKKTAWDIINETSKGYTLYYRWENPNQGTYFGVVYDIKNFGFGKDYVFYEDKIKWCENLDIDNCSAHINKDKPYEIVLTDKYNNCLIIGVKNADAESFLE